MRRFILFVHLYIAAFTAPVFVLLAISGGLYLIDIKGEVTKTAIELPVGTMLDFSNPDLKQDVTALLAAQGISHSFEYLAQGRTSAQTRPSSRTSYEFRLTDGELTAARVEPNIPKVMIELHKGHGPGLYTTYQKLVAIALIFTVLSGVWIGLASKALRNKTGITLGGGLVVFIVLAFMV